ncbi:YdbL family protein [Parvularcula dongshanensis]|uniref:DUF1318 domain-containing protein n=1 Tax=Parvularcula dongshanensis TaxID=1173995 RepID=A0A840I5B2_9PROT|nr:YdbL family protein [Parvularcula dongshanensis]MBB4659471.1 hypothetical protein [Parvularcula dongshanensis]
MTRTLLAALLLAASALPAAAAVTPATDAAKAQCIIGERIDGYLGFVDEARADEALRREVREVNQKRSAAYEDLARRNGVTPRVAAQATAERLINDAPSGTCVQDESGAWNEVP